MPFCTTMLQSGPCTVREEEEEEDACHRVASDPIYMYILVCLNFFQHFFI